MVQAKSALDVNHNAAGGSGSNRGSFKSSFNSSYRAGAEAGAGGFSGAGGGVSGRPLTAIEQALKDVNAKFRAGGNREGGSVRRGEGSVRGVGGGRAEGGSIRGGGLGLGWGGEGSIRGRGEGNSLRGGVGGGRGEGTMTPLRAAVGLLTPLTGPSMEGVKFRAGEASRPMKEGMGGGGGMSWAAGGGSASSSDNGAAGGGAGGGGGDSLSRTILSALNSSVDTDGDGDGDVVVDLRPVNLSRHNRLVERMRDTPMMH